MELNIFTVSLYLLLAATFKADLTAIVMFLDTQ